MAVLCPFQEPIPTSLLKMSGEHVSRAVKMFSGILKYQGDTGEAIDQAQRIELAQKLLHQGLKRPELKDELYMQLLKQTRGNPSQPSQLKAWELFHVVAASMPPSKVRADACAIQGHQLQVISDTAPVLVTHGIRNGSTAGGAWMQSRLSL